MAIVLGVLGVLAVAPTSLHGPPADALGPSAAFHLDTVSGPSPPPMERAAATYDPTDSMILMFGGQEWNDQVLSTTWTFAHGNWTNRTPALSTFPPARWGGSMAYDAADGEAILFGGCPTMACPTALGDTWAYSQGRWSDLTPLQNSSPSARDLASMVYDSQSGSIVLFGGQPSASATTTDNDTWVFSRGQWAPAPLGAASVEPTARYDASMAYDPSTNSVVLYGGVTSLNGGSLLGDTWGYTGGNWTQLLSGSTAPSPRRGAMFTFDAQDGYGLLVGGYNRGTYFGDVWTLSSGGWSSIATSGSGPGALFGGVAADDAADGYVLFFSGQASGGYLTPTWAYAHGSWSTLVSPAPTGTSPVEQLLIFQLIFLVPVVLVAVIAIGVARFRARRRPQGFQLRPGEPVQWIPTRGFAAQNAQALLVPLIFSFILIPFDLTFVATGVLTPFGVAVVVVLPLVVIFGVFYLAFRTNIVRSIGVASAGIVVQRGGSQMRIAWDDLSLPDFPLRGRGFLLRYSAPNESMGGGFVRATLEQAKAIVGSPNAPAWPISASVGRALGLPPRAAPQSVAAQPAPPPPPAAPLRSTGQVPQGSAPPAPSPAAWAPPNPPPPPPPPPSFAPAVQPVVVSPPAPLYQVRCPGCSSTFPMGKYAFCPTCGRRLG